MIHNLILFQIYLHPKTVTVYLQPTAADLVCVGAITFLKLVFEISAEAVSGLLAVYYSLCQLLGHRSRNAEPNQLDFLHLKPTASIVDVRMKSPTPNMLSQHMELPLLSL